jgi:ribosome maturation factor RimP
LRKPTHFESAIGRRVAVRTDRALDGSKNRFKGEVVEAADGAVTLATAGDELRIPYESIVRANLIDEG